MIAKLDKVSIENKRTPQTTAHALLDPNKKEYISKLLVNTTCRSIFHTSEQTGLSADNVLTPIFM